MDDIKYIKRLYEREGVSIREIIRLTGLGFSQRNIMASCGVAQKTVVKVQKRARELNISWPLDESMTDS